MVAAIVRGVGNAVMNSEVVRTKSRALPTLDAYTLLLGGIGLMHSSDPRDFDKSREAFEQLIERFQRLLLRADGQIGQGPRAGADGSLVGGVLNLLEQRHGLGRVADSRVAIG